MSENKEHTEISMELTSEELETVAGGAVSRRAVGLTVDKISINEQSSFSSANRDGVVLANQQSNFDEDFTALVAEDNQAG
jgi:hypothetical protein